jgi:hypothetical protein
VRNRQNPRRIACRTQTGARRNRKAISWGLPYDWRKPTAERVRARWWNPDDHRLLTPKSYGWGYDLNLYWLIHPLRYISNS